MVGKVQEFPKGTCIFSPSFFYDVFSTSSNVRICRVKVDFEFYPNGSFDLPIPSEILQQEREKVEQEVNIFAKFK